MIMYRNRAYSLFEILLTVMVVAVVGAFAAPHYGRAGIRDNNLGQLCDALQSLRAQIALYKVQHENRPPMQAVDGTVAFDPEFEQMIYCTDIHGRLKAIAPRTRSDEVYPLGPYLNKVPKNPFNGSRTLIRVHNRGEISSGDGAGWAYIPETGDIFANDSVEHAGL